MIAIYKKEEGVILFDHHKRTVTINYFGKVMACPKE